MSFTSALPANLPKLQITTPIKRSADVATGYELVTLLIRMSADVAVAFDVYTPIRRYVDYAIGYDTYKPVEVLTLLKDSDVAEGLEYLRRVIHVSDSPTALLEVVGRIDRQLPAEVAKAVELLVRTVITSDFGAGRYAVPRRQFSVKERAVARDIYALTRRYETALYGLEQFTVGYPISVSPVQDAENAYQRAFQQLSALQQGRYAYAQDWNTLADYAKSIMNVLVDMFRRLYEKGYKYYIDPYNKVLECQRILTTYRYLKTGDVIMPEHTNTLIDVVKCLDETTKQLPLLRELVLVDTDDWDTAKRYVTDGTIVFVNYGTKAMTPDEVRTIVNTMNVVFAIMINSLPLFERSPGAFYGVFYTSINPRICETLSKCFPIIDDAFKQPYGFNYCVYPECAFTWYLWAWWDDVISAEDKVAYARPWAATYETPSAIRSCGYAYAKYNRGAIIEVPYDGVWSTSYFLNWYIGAIAHLLLGEPNYCLMSKSSTKLFRVVWMASYKPPWSRFHYCGSTEDCLINVMSQGGWRIVDLRKR